MPPTWTHILSYKPETIPVMDAGNDILAVAGERDLTGKDAAFV